MIAPWEDARKIQGRRPKPIPPDRAPITKLPDGRAALEREGQLASLIPSENPPADDRTIDTFNTGDAVAL